MGFSASPRPCCTNPGALGLAFEFETRRRAGAGRKFHAPTWAALWTPLKKTTSRAAMAPAAKLGDSQWMFFMDFS